MCCWSYRRLQAFMWGYFEIWTVRIFFWPYQDIEGVACLNLNFWLWAGRPVSHFEFTLPLLLPLLSFLTYPVSAHSISLLTNLTTTPNPIFSNLQKNSFRSSTLNTAGYRPLSQISIKISPYPISRSCLCLSGCCGYRVVCIIQFRNSQILCFRGNWRFRPKEIVDSFRVRDYSVCWFRFRQICYNSAEQQSSSTNTLSIYILNSFQLAPQLFFPFFPECTTLFSKTTISLSKQSQYPNNSPTILIESTPSAATLTISSSVKRALTSGTQNIMLQQCVFYFKMRMWSQGFIVFRERIEDRDWIEEVWIFIMPIYRDFIESFRALSFFCSFSDQSYRYMPVQFTLQKHTLLNSYSQNIFSFSLRMRSPKLLTSLPLSSLIHTSPFLNPILASATQKTKVFLFQLCKSSKLSTSSLNQYIDQKIFFLAFSPRFLPNCQFLSPLQFLLKLTISANRLYPVKGYAMLSRSSRSQRLAVRVRIQRFILKYFYFVSRWTVRAGLQRMQASSFGCFSWGIREYFFTLFQVTLFQLSFWDSASISSTQQCPLLLITNQQIQFTSAIFPLLLPTAQKSTESPISQKLQSETCLPGQHSLTLKISTLLTLTLISFSFTRIRASIFFTSNMKQSHPIFLFISYYLEMLRHSRRWSWVGVYLRRQRVRVRNQRFIFRDYLNQITWNYTVIVSVACCFYFNFFSNSKLNSRTLSRISRSSLIMDLNISPLSLTGCLPEAIQLLKLIIILLKISLFF